MKSLLLNGAVAIALLSGAGIAAAQTYNMDRAPGAKPSSTMSTPAQLSLNEQQKQAIWESVGKGVSTKAPASFQASIGASVPIEITLRPLPSDVTSKVPQMKNYQYAKLENEVLLVDPATHKVVDIIQK